MWKKLGQIVLFGAINGAIGSVWDAAASGELTKGKNKSKKKHKGGKKRRGNEPRRITDPNVILYDV